MRSPSRRALLSLAVAAIWTLALPAIAAETSGVDVGLIPEGEVVDDDLYAAGVQVLVMGTVQGDLIAAAAERIVVEGEVMGSVTALAPEVVVRGRVGGAVRAAAGTLVVDGEVGGDVVTSSWTIRLTPRSHIGGEVLFWSRRLSAAGTIDETLRGSASRIELAGAIHENVNVSVGRLSITGQLTVDGDLSYRSDRDADLAGAVIGGTVVKRAELPPNIRVRAIAWISRLLAVIFVAIVAATVVWLWPTATSRAAQRVRSPKAAVVGFLVALSPALLIGLGWLLLRFAPAEAGVPLLAVLVPMFLALVSLLAVTALAAVVPTAAAVGRAVFRKWGIHGATLGGALLLGLVWLLPWVGWVVPVVAIPLGLGAWLTDQADLAVT
ncbi:MAG TPA: polymer-forming cytoskeletal protein [Acidimicrobiia bacterium]